MCCATLSWEAFDYLSNWSLWSFEPRTAPLDATRSRNGSALRSLPSAAQSKQLLIGSTQEKGPEDRA